MQKFTLNDIIHADFVIPNIEPNTLNKLASNIVPIIRKPNDALSYIDPVDIEFGKFTIAPSFTKPVTDLKSFDMIYTLHTSQSGVFSPTIKEVLSFIQHRDDVDDICAFMTLFKQNHPSNKGVIGITILYKKM